MPSRNPDKRVIKKNVSNSPMPSVGNIGIIGQSTINVSSVNVNGQSVSIDSNAISYIDNITPGVASANKAIVVDNNKNVEGIEDMTVDELYVDNSLVTGIINTGATVSDSSYMNDIQPGIQTPGKIVSANSNKETNATMSGSKLILNGGEVKSKTIETSYYPRLTAIDIVNSYTPRNIATITAATYTSTYNYAPSYWKIGKIYVLSTVGYDGTYYNSNHIICEDVFKSGGGSFNIAVSAYPLFDAYSCYYNATTDRHFLPFTSSSGSSMTMKVYVSPTGDPSTWTSGSWTISTVCSITGLVANNINSSNYGYRMEQTLRWSSLLNKYVILGFPDSAVSSLKIYNTLYISDDGITWTKGTTISDMTAVGGHLVVTPNYLLAMNSSSNIFYSTNGTSWTTKAIGNTGNYESSKPRYFEGCNLIYGSFGSILASNVIGLASGASMDQSVLQFSSIGNGQFTSQSCQEIPSINAIVRNSFIYFYNENRAIGVVGYVLGNYLYAMGATSTTFALNYSIKYNIPSALSDMSTSKYELIHPVSYLMFESKSRIVVKDFAWNPILKKYIVLGNAEDGFNTAYTTNINLYHSDDMETFTYVNYFISSSGVNAVAVNEKTGAVYVYGMGGTECYRSIDNGFTFFTIMTGGNTTSLICFVDSIGTIVIIKSYLVYVVLSEPLALIDSTNSITLYSSTSNGNILYLQGNDYISIGNGAGSTYCYGSILGMLMGITGSTRNNVPGSFTTTTGTNNITLYPTVDSSMHISKNYTFARSTNNQLGSGYSNICYVDPLNMFVAIRTNTSYTSTLRLVYSFDQYYWSEVRFNCICVNTVYTNLPSIKYDRNSGYLYVFGSTGLFRSIHSTKFFNYSKSYILDTPSTLYLREDSGYELHPFIDVSNKTMTDICYALGTYVACGDNVISKGNRIGFMTDTTLSGSWVGIASAIIGTTSRFVLISANTINTSTNATTWSSQTISGNWSHVSWSYMQSCFAIAGENKLGWSTDGSTWTIQTVTGVWRSIRYFNGYWLAVGSNKIAYTTDKDTAVTVISLTGEWYDSAFGGQWALAGVNKIAFSTAINSLSQWSIMPVAGKSYTNVHYSDSLRQFFFSGNNFSVYIQSINQLKHLPAESACVKSVWLPKMQTFILLGSTIRSTQFLGLTTDNSICTLDSSIVIARATNNVNSFISLSDNNTTSTTSGVINVTGSTANSILSTMSNNTDGSSVSFINNTDGIKIQTDKGINLEFSKLLKINDDILNISANDVQYLGIGTAGQSSDGSFLSVDYDSNFTASGITAGGLIVNGIIYASSKPITMQSVTPGTVSANKAVQLDSNKSLTNVNNLLTECLMLGYLNIKSLNPKGSDAIISNAQSSLECSGNAIISAAYNSKLDVYVAINNDTAEATASNVERMYINVSKDGKTWNKCYTGIQGYAGHIFAVEPRTTANTSTFYNLLGLGANSVGFIIFMINTTWSSKVIFTPDLVNFYMPNLRSGMSTFSTIETYYSSSSLIFNIDGASRGFITPTLIINPNYGHPNKFLSVNNSGVSTFTNSAATDTAIVHAGIISNASPLNISYATSNKIAIARDSNTTISSVSPTQTINHGACAYSYGGNAYSMLRVLVCNAGVVLYGSLDSTSYSSVTLNSSYNLLKVAWNWDLGKFLVVSNNQKIWISDYNSATTWTEITVPNIFSGISWSFCATAGPKGFIVGHDNNGSNYQSTKACRIDENGNFIIMSHAHLRNYRYGDYGLKNYVIPSCSGGNDYKISYSTDGIYWNTALQTTDTLLSLVFMKNVNKFIAITNIRNIYVSSDIVNWSLAYTYSNTSGYLNNIVYSDARGLAVIVLSGVSTNNIITTSDGSAFQTYTFSPSCSTLTYVGYSAPLDKFLLSSAESGTLSATTSNFTSFTTCVSSGVERPCGKNIFWSPSLAEFRMLNTSTNSLWASSDGVNWTKSSGFVNYLAGTIDYFYGERQYIEVPGFDIVTTYNPNSTGSTLYSLKNGQKNIIGTFAGSINADSHTFLIYNPDDNCILAYKNGAWTRPGETFQIIDLDEYKYKISKEIPLEYLDKTQSNTPSLGSYQIKNLPFSTLDAGADDLTAMKNNLGVPISGTMPVTSNYSIAWSSSLGIFVSVGENSGPVWSNNGKDWTSGTVNSGAANIWMKVIWCQFISKFVAVAYGGTNRAMYSSDGKTWTSVNLGATLEACLWIGLACSSNIIVATAYSGTKKIMTSTDGINWTAGISGDDAGSWMSICWSESLGTFSSVSNSATKRAMYSTDGINWVNRQTSSDTNGWKAICWSPKLKMFIAVANSGSYRIMKSLDGRSWLPTAATAYDTYAYSFVFWSEIIGAFIAFHSSGTLLSYNGITWSIYTGLSISTRGCAESTTLNTLVIVSDNSTTFYYVKDYGLTVASTTTFETGSSYLGCVFYSSYLNKWFCGNYTTTPNEPSTISYSLNGLEWMRTTSTCLSAFCITEGYVSGNYRLVALGYETGVNLNTLKAAWSSDGLRWYETDCGATNATWAYVCWSSTYGYVAISWNGVSAISADGITWSTNNLPGTASGWRSIAWSSSLGLFIAVASSGTSRFATSTNGSTWTSVVSPDESNGWQGIAWSSTLGMFVAVANSGTNRIYTSVDGINWTARGNAITNAATFGLVIWINSMFVARSYSNSHYAFVSTDGINWFGKYHSSASTMDHFRLGVGPNNEMVTFNSSYSKCYINNLLNSYTSVPMTNYTQGITWTGNALVATTTQASFKTMRSVDYGMTWTSVAASSTTNGWAGVAYGNGFTVAVAGSGSTRSMYSTDNGSSWTGASISGGESNGWNGICYGGGKFVACAVSGTGRFASCADNSISLSAASSGSSDSYAWYSVCYGGATGSEKYVAVGTGVASSSDGSNWDVSASISSATTWLNVCWSSSAGLFIAVGQHASLTTTNVIMTSPDATTWTLRTNPLAANLKCVRAGSNIILAMAASAAAAVSTNGIDWVVSSARGTSNDMCYIPEINAFVTGGASGNGYDISVYKDLSASILDVKTSLTYSSISPYSSAASPARIVIPGTVSPMAFYTSTNGLDWTRIVQSQLTANSIYGIAWGNPTATPGGIFVCLSNGGTNRLLYSYDGLTWYQKATIDDSLSWAGIAYSPSLGIFTACTSGKCMYSYDGITWTQGTTSTTGYYMTIIWCSSLGMFLGFGISGANRIAKSTDGITWTSVTTTYDASMVIRSAAWSQELGMVVAVCTSGSGRILTSTDGNNWNQITAPNETNAWSTIAWFKEQGVFVAGSITSSTTSYMVSPDGVTWYTKTHPGGISRQISHVAYFDTWKTGFTYDIAISYCICLLIPYVPPALTLTYNVMWNVIWSKAFGKFIAFKKNDVYTNDKQVYLSSDGYSWTYDSTGYASIDSASRLKGVLSYATVNSGDLIITCRGTGYIQINSAVNGITQFNGVGVGNATALYYSPYLKCLLAGGSAGYIAACYITKPNTVVQLFSKVLPTTIYVNTITSCNGQHLFIQSNPTNMYYYSKGLDTMNSGSLPSINSWYFAHKTSEWSTVYTPQESAGRLVAVNESGDIYYTDDGINWTSSASYPSKKFVSISYIQEFNAFIACDFNSSSELLYSIDNAVSWSALTLPGSYKVNSVAYSAVNDTLVIITNNGSSLSSISVTLPKIPSGGNVLRFNSTSGTNTFNLTSRGGIAMGDYLNTYLAENTDDQPLIAIGSGSAYKPSSASWTVSSDSRIKKDIITIEPSEASKKLDKLELVRYKWSDDFIEQANVEDIHKLGWLAQDVENVLPTAVRTISGFGLDDMKALDSDQIIVLMHGTIQDLIKRYRDIENKLNELS